jgi:hypothetical protein
MFKRLRDSSWLSLSAQYQSCTRFQEVEKEGVWVVSPLWWVFKSIRGRISTSVCTKQG